MKFIQSIVLAIILGHVHQMSALSQRNLNIITACSSVALTTCSLVALHSWYLKDSNYSGLQKVGIDLLALLAAGGGIGALTYYLLRKKTPEYKIALAEFTRKVIAEDPFYTNINNRSTEDILVLSSLYFGPDEPLRLAHQHIDLLQQQLDSINVLISEAFNEIKNNSEAILLRSKCMNLIKEIFAMKQQLETIVSTVARNSGYQPRVILESPEDQRMRSMFRTLARIYT